MAETDSLKITILVVAAIVLLAIFMASSYVYIGAQGPPPPTPTVKIEPSFADVKLGPGTVAVIVRDTKGANQMIVSTFYWQKLQGIDKPIMLSTTDVVPVVKDVAVASKGPLNPADVASVHVSLVTIVQRMEWVPQPPVTPAK